MIYDRPDEAISAVAASAPDRLAIAEGDHRLSYRRLDHEVEHLAEELRSLGVQRGHVVTVWMPAWWEATALVNAALRVGAVPHTLAHSSGGDEARRVLSVARPACLFIGADRPEAAGRMIELAATLVPAGRIRSVRAEATAARAEEGGPDPVAPRLVTDAAALIFTSGTAGDPKGVVHGHSSLHATCAAVAERFGIGSGSVIGMASPIGHVRWVLYGGMLPFLLGGTLITASGWSPAAWAEMAAEVGCDFAAFSPKHLEDLIALARAGRRVPVLRTVSCGGSYLPSSLLQQAEQRMGCRIVRSYGCTEFPSATGSDPGGTEAERWTFDGRPLDGVEMQLVADDSADDTDSVSLAGSASMRRIRLRGSHAARGVLKPDSDEVVGVTGPDGWLDTADFGEVTDGCLRIVGRKADMIIRNGENINASELETMLSQHPLIEDVAVVGRRDPVTGERVCAVCVVRDPDGVDVGELARFLDERGTARWKWPESVVLVDSIERTTSGKIRRGDLWHMVNPRTPAAERS